MHELCVSCDICVYHPWFVCFFPGEFLSSRLTGACPVTTDLILRVNVRTTTTEQRVEVCKTTKNTNKKRVLGSQMVGGGGSVWCLGFRSASPPSRYSYDKYNVWGNPRWGLRQKVPEPLTWGTRYLTRKMTSEAFVPTTRPSFYALVLKTQCTREITSLNGSSSHMRNSIDQGLFRAKTVTPTVGWLVFEKVVWWTLDLETE